MASSTALSCLSNSSLLDEVLFLALPAGGAAAGGGAAGLAAGLGTGGSGFFGGGPMAPPLGDSGFALGTLGLTVFSGRAGDTFTGGLISVKQNIIMFTISARPTLK